jgi:hypothetical protein
MLQFATVTVNFPTTRDREQSINSFADFSNNVRSAQVAINGWDISYRDGDHHLGRMKVDSSMSNINGRRVNFTTNLLLRDFSGNIDDTYGGSVDILVIAEVA